MGYERKRSTRKECEWRERKRETNERGLFRGGFVGGGKYEDSVARRRTSQTRKESGVGASVGRLVLIRNGLMSEFYNISNRT